MAVLEYISVSGFGSYGSKSQTLTLNGQGPVAIIGDNGAGKSTLVSKALTWCLYGKCPPERMGSGTRAISGKAVVGSDQHEAIVEIRIIDPDNESLDWTIVRERKLTGADSITVYDHGTPLADATQTMIDGIVGADYETWCRTVVRGQGDPWSFAEATDSRKRAILDAISGAAELEEAFDRAKVQRSSAIKAHEIAERRVDDIKSRLARIDVSATERKLKEWTTEKGVKLAEIEAEVKGLHELHSAKIDSDALLSGSLKKRAALEAAEPELDRKPYQDAVVAAEKFYRESYAQLRAASEEATKLSGLTLGDPCPTCDQAIGPIVVKKLGAATSKRNILESEAKKAEAETRNCQKIMRDADEWLVNARLEWKDDLSALPTGSEEAPAVQRELNQAVRRLKDLVKTENPFQSRFEAEIESIGKLKHELGVTQAVAQHAKWTLNAAQSWLEALGPKGARAHMAEAALASIEVSANRWLAVLSDRGMAVEFPATREVKGKLREEIKTIVHIDDNGVSQQRDLLTFSGGERKRVNLAVDLGVASACGGSGLSLSLLVLDEEVFSGMDESGKAAVVSALHNAGVADVVMIDHDPRLSSALPRTITVSRDSKGHSTLEEIEHG